MRNTMPQYPLIQPFLTWLTATPFTLELNNWDGRTAPHPLTHLGFAIIKLVAGVALSWIGWTMLVSTSQTESLF